MCFTLWVYLCLYKCHQLPPFVTNLCPSEGSRGTPRTVISVQIKYKRLNWVGSTKSRELSRKNYGTMSGSILSNGSAMMSLSAPGNLPPSSAL